MLGNLISMRLPVPTLEEFVDKPRYLNFEEKNLQMEFKTLQMEAKLEQEIKARNRSRNETGTEATRGCS